MDTILLSQETIKALEMIRYNPATHKGKRGYIWNDQSQTICTIAKSHIILLMDIGFIEEHKNHACGYKGHTWIDLTPYARNWFDGIGHLLSTLE